MPGTTGVVGWIVLVGTLLYFGAIRAAKHGVGEPLVWSLIVFEPATVSTKSFQADSGQR